MEKTYTFAEFSDTGLLWLINRVAFHPRGFQFSLACDDDGNAIGWTVVPHDPSVTYSLEIDSAKSAAFEALLVEAHASGATPVEPCTMCHRLDGGHTELCPIELARQLRDAQETIVNILAARAQPPGPLAPTAPVQQELPKTDLRDVRNVLLTHPRFGRASFAASYKDEASAKVAGEY